MIQTYWSRIQHVRAKVTRSFWLLPVHVQLHIWCVIQFFHVWVCRSKTTTTQYWTLDWKHRSGKRKNICMWVKKELRMRAAWVVTCNKFYLIYIQDYRILISFFLSSVMFDVSLSLFSIIRSILLFHTNSMNYGTSLWTLLTCEFSYWRLEWWNKVKANMN